MAVDSRVSRSRSTVPPGVSEDSRAPTHEGPAWPPIPEPLPDAPKWHGARAIAAVWRDAFPMAVGGTVAAAYQPFAGVRLDDGWDVDPEPGSDLDVEQAIGAKVHLALRLMPILASAQLVQVEPDQATYVPDWDDIERAFGYAQKTTLPCSPMFIDFESADGLPTSWYAETWPLPFHLRGALLWQRESALCGIPFGSVAGKHPFGGTDYQAWSRWIYWQRPNEEPPPPGAGDNIGLGENVISWVRFSDSICAHQAAIGYHLMARVLRVLWSIETFEMELVPPRLPRPERRRAARAKQNIGLTVEELPHRPTSEQPEADEEPDGWESMLDPCPFPSCHGRLIEAHTHWHEAMAAYDDPGQFVLRLNPLIQAMRNVTFALQKEISDHAGLGEWYEGWQQRLKADPHLKWAVAARNHVVKEGDLAVNSTARAWIAGDHIVSEPVEVLVAPTASAAEIARSLQLPGLEETVRREGVLVVERRWVTRDFPEEELLDLLAHDFARLAELVTDAHEQLGASIRRCEKSLDDPCGSNEVLPSGRLGCMSVSDQLRTSHRSLSNGAPISVGVQTLRRPSIDVESVRQRYARVSLDSKPKADLLKEGERLHQIARGVMEADGEHITVAWLMRRNYVVSQLTLIAHDQRELFLTMEALGAEARKLGAHQLIVNAEGWEAPSVPPHDPRYLLLLGTRF